MPTLRVEGLPVTLLEALAAGLPVIASPHAGEAALPLVRVDPRDRAALAASLGSVKAGWGPRRSLLPPAYTLGGATSRYLALFERLLRERRA